MFIKKGRTIYDCPLLECILSLLCINDLPSVTEFNTLLFADDTTLILSNGSVHELEKSVNSELTSIVAWMQANKLMILKRPILFSSVINAKDTV